MKENLPKERAALVGIAAVVLAFGGYAVMKGQRQPSPISFHELVSAPSEPARPEKAPRSGNARPLKPEAAPARAPATAPNFSRQKKPPPSQPVSLNGADANLLESLPGVGPATAEKILAYRREHGRFTSVDELIAVKGIGEKKLAKLRPFLRL